MKKSAIKMIAGVSALAIFSSISATAIPAFAEEYDAIQEQDYVATFADEQTQNVANYLLENGVSMEEAQEMMEHYVNGRAMIEQRENAENGISLLSDDEEEPKVCHYLDLPIQHANDEILRRMGRRTSKQELIDKIDFLRSCLLYTSPSPRD